MFKYKYTCTLSKLNFVFENITLYSNLKISWQIASSLF